MLNKKRRQNKEKYFVFYWAQGQIMNREELLKLREAYINAEPYRIIDKWFDDYIKHGHTSIVMSNYKDDVKEDVKRILEEKGFKVKVKGGGVGFDGYPNKTWIYIENV